VTQQHVLLPFIPGQSLIRLYTTTIVHKHQGFKLYFAGSYFQVVTIATCLAKQLLRQSDCRVAAWWRICSARHLLTVLPMFQRWMENTHYTMPLTHVMTQHTTVHSCWQGAVIFFFLFLWIPFWTTGWRGLQTIVPSLPEQRSSFHLRHRCCSVCGRCF